jgi:acyl carrier protein
VLKNTKAGTLLAFASSAKREMPGQNQRWRIGAAACILALSQGSPVPTQGTHGESAMEDTEIQEKVISIVAEQMGVDKGEINRETNFVNDLNADSLDTVELVMEFEDEFETSIPDEDAEKIQTVGRAIEYLRDHLAKANKSSA